VVQAGRVRVDIKPRESKKCHDKPRLCVRCATVSSQKTAGNEWANRCRRAAVGGQHRSQPWCRCHRLSLPTGPDLVQSNL